MDISEFYENISLNVKFFREKIGITQEQLAEKANLSTDYIGKIEIGKNKPGLIGLFKIIKALDIPVSEFFKNFK